jgi:hypothetical protein
MNKYAMATVALWPALMFAQDTEKPVVKPEHVTKVIHVRYARAEALRDLVEIGGGRCQANNGLKVLVVSGTASDIASAEQTVKEIDVPSPTELARDVEITVYVLGATQKGTVEATAEMEPVIRQLKSVFPYGSYQLLETVLIRGHEGRGAYSAGLLKNFPNAETAFLNRYNINCELDTPPAAGPADRTIRFTKFSFNTGVPNSDVRLTLETNLDVQEGQKVVVGNTNIDGGNAALFVVVTAKFVR